MKLASFLPLFIFFLGMIIVSPLHLFAQQTDTDTTKVTQPTAQQLLLEQISSDIQQIRVELSEQDSETTEQLLSKLDSSLDRLEALDERMIGLESRIARINAEMGGFGSNFTIAIAIMICIAFITIVLVWIQRKKYIDPVNIQLARFEAELQKIDKEKANRLQKAMQDLGTNDPLVAQLLKKYKLDE